MSCIIIQITTTGSADNSLSTVSNDNTLYVDSFNVHFQITEEPQYFTAITVKKTTTALQKEEWEMMGGGHSTLSKDWKEVVTSKLEIVNPYCSFAYSWRWKKRTAQENIQISSLDVEDDAASRIVIPHLLLPSIQTWK